MLEIPSDGLLYTLFELEAWLPTQFLLELGAVDGIACIVAETVCDVGDELKAEALRVAEDPVHCLDHDLDQVYVLPLVEAADVVCLCDFAFMEDQVDGACVVLHIEPVTDILALAVYRERLAVPDVVDEQRNELLRELVWSVVVRAVGHDGRKAVGVVICSHEMVRGCLRSAVGAVRVVLGGLVEEVVTISLVALR